jgi:hypothetical protein
MVNIFRRAYDY